MWMRRASSANRSPPATGGIGAVTFRDHRRAQSDYVPIDTKTSRALDFAQRPDARNIHACALLHQILLVIWGNSLRLASTKGCVESR